MKKPFKLIFLLRHAGMSLVYFGALLLVISYLFSWTDSNALLLLCLLSIAAGIILHVLTLKHDSRY